MVISPTTKATFNLTNWDQFPTAPYNLTSVLYAVNITTGCVMLPSGPFGAGSIVIVIENDGFNYCKSYSQMDAALNGLEAGLVVMVGTTDYDNAVDVYVLMEGRLTFLTLTSGLSLFALAKDEIVWVEVTNRKLNINI